MIRGRILYLVLVAIIIVLAFNAGALSTEAKVALYASGINSSDSEAGQVEAESLMAKISGDVLQSQSDIIEKNDVNHYIHKSIYVLTVLLAALMICMLIALQNNMFFLRKKEQKIKESHEFEVLMSD